MIALRLGDVWTPTRGKQVKNHARTITGIWLVPEGERISYWDDVYVGEGQCWGPTFRQWIASVKAVRTVDEEVIRIETECETT